MRRIILFVAAAVLATAAAAQNYRWVDQNGRVQYGDNPPPGVKATPMRGGGAVRGAAPAAPAAPDAKAADGKPADGKPAATAPNTTAEQDAAFLKRQQDAQKQAEKSAQAEKEAAHKKDQCARAQEYLRSLESGQRIALTDKNGERVFLDDDQRVGETAKARELVKQSCS